MEVAVAGALVLGMLVVRRGRQWVWRSVISESDEYSWLDGMTMLAGARTWTSVRTGVLEEDGEDGDTDLSTEEVRGWRLSTGS